jgi:DNA processing protein
MSGLPPFATSSIISAPPRPRSTCCPNCPHAAARPDRHPRREPPKKRNAELNVAERHRASFVGIGEPDYPPLLRQIVGAPPLLAVKGNLNVVSAPAVGIVGARNASISGMKFAGLLARDIGRAGYSIVSGLARGIDTAAHRASLDTGTIAAMAGGLDKPYPPENIGLLGELTDGQGLAVSEMPFGWEPRARDFPRRNRLIAGMALGLVVVEAAVRSGSLITAAQCGGFRPPGFCGAGLAARHAV